MASRPQPLVAAHLERDHILKDIFKNVGSFAKEFDEINYDILKQEVLKPVLDNNFDPEIQIRGFMKTFERTQTYKDAFAKIQNRDVQDQIEAFVAGSSPKDVVAGKGFEVSQNPSPQVKHHFSLIEALEKLVIDIHELKVDIKESLHPLHKHIENLPILFENGGKEKVKVYSDVPFENWGLSVQNTPKLTFFPSTVHGVQEIVRYAIKNDLRVRCGGYRHSWSPIFSQDSEILITFLSLEQVTTIPDPLPILPGEYNAATATELKTIELGDETTKGKRLCRVGAAVTAEDFRRWAVANNSWSLPVDVILVEVTFGGANGSICHGAGRERKTINDYVRRVEYVDCHGDLKMVDDPKLIKTAAGALGLLGVVTHLTFELDAMTYAVMKPLKVDIGLAIPPLSKDQIPPALRSDWFNAPNASEQMAAAKVDFDRRATSDYYAEWFWFTYQRKAWVNTWDATSDPTGYTDYPDAAQTFLEWIQGWLGGVITSNPFFQAIPGYWQAQLLATVGMAALPPTLGEDNNPTIKTTLPNALHFRRGTQNMRVRDFELQIPLQPRKDDPSKPDFEIVQRAWWDVINLVYADAETGSPLDPSSPMRLTLELRIMGGSDVTMAPQRGNELGSASIEVLTIPDSVTDGEWAAFLQKVAEKWMSYGEKMNVRPHWGKEWVGLQFKGVDSREYLKTVAYPEQIKEFKAALEEIGGSAWRLSDLKKRFSNELWDQMIFDGKQSHI